MTERSRQSAQALPTERKPLKVDGYLADIVGMDTHTTRRSWEIRTRHRNGNRDFNVICWPYQRQAYRFVIDWFVEDPDLVSIDIRDESGYAEGLHLERNHQ